MHLIADLISSLTVVGLLRQYEILSSEIHDQTSANTIETPLNDQSRHSHAFYTTASESPTTSAVQHSGSTTPFSSQRSQKPPFGCGCGKSAS